MKKNSGITLIALVITIIALLILAGVSIAMLIGENGILNQANEAAKRTEEAEAEERVKIAVLGSYGSEGNIDGDKIKNELQSQGEFEGIIPGKIEFNGYEFLILENGEVTSLERREILELNVSIENDKSTSAIEVYSETENVKIQDNYGNDIVIPSGFGIASDSGVNISEGIVVEDKENGNQFVWIPVGIINNNGVKHTIELSRYEFATDGTPTKKEDEDVIELYYKELATSSDGNASAKNLETFEIKTLISGGYYIARYEPSNNNGIVQSKANKTAWTSITQPNASIESKEMYQNETTFTSDLINSLAWDTALVYIQMFSGDEDYSQLGHHANDEKMKITNMASNVREWSTETSINPGYPCVYRGGAYDNVPSPVSSRYNRLTTHNNHLISFRPILYL